MVYVGGERGWSRRVEEGLQKSEGGGARNARENRYETSGKKNAKRKVAAGSGRGGGGKGNSSRKKRRRTEELEYWKARRDSRCFVTARESRSGEFWGALCRLRVARPRPSSTRVLL